MFKENISTILDQGKIFLGTSLDTKVDEKELRTNFLQWLFIDNGLIDLKLAAEYAKRIMDGETYLLKDVNTGWNRGAGQILIDYIREDSSDALIQASVLKNLQDGNFNVQVTDGGGGAGTRISIDINLTKHEDISYV